MASQASGANGASGVPKTLADLEQMIWRQAMPDGVEPVWHTVTWDVPSGVVSVARVRELLDLVSLNEVPTPLPRESAAILRVLREMANDGILEPGEAPNKRRNVRVPKVANDAEETTWALASWLPGDRQTKRLGVRQGLTVTYHKRPAKGEPTLTYSNPEAEAALAPMLEKYQNGYTTRDITSRVLSYCVRRAGGIGMRPQGGVYIVPPTGGETVERLKLFIKYLTAESGLDASHFTDLQSVESGELREDMRYHSHRALIGDLRMMERHLRDMLRESRADKETGKSKVKAETALGYLNEVNEVAARAALWRDAARLEVSEFDQALDTLRDAFTAVRDGVVVKSQFEQTLRVVDQAINQVEDSGVQSAETADPDKAIASDEASDETSDETPPEA